MLGMIDEPKPDEARQYLERYLKHLEIDNAAEPNYVLLEKLINAHVLHVPWENFRFFYHKEIILDIGQLIAYYEKYHLGGLCYQLNLTFYWLLKQLGFNVHIHMVKLYATQHVRYQQPRSTHPVSIVTLNQERYLCDVAWRGFYCTGLTTPLKVAFNTRQHPEYRIISVVNDDSRYLCQLEKYIDASYQLQYKIHANTLTETEVRHCIDYTDSPAERYSAHNFVFIKPTPNGLLTINNDVITIIDNGNIKKEDVHQYGSIKQAVQAIANFA